MKRKSGYLTDTLRFPRYTDPATRAVLSPISVKQTIREKLISGSRADKAIYTHWFFFGGTSRFHLWLILYCPSLGQKLKNAQNVMGSPQNALIFFCPKLLLPRWWGKGGGGRGAGGVSKIGKCSECYGKPKKCIKIFFRTPPPPQTDIATTAVRGTQSRFQLPPCSNLI